MSDQNDLVGLTADIVAAHLANNTVAVNDVRDLIQKVHGALQTLVGPSPDAEEEKKPIVSVRASVKPDYIVCLECGKKQTMLKRHLGAAHGISPAEYRKQYGLPDSYPMTAPDYAEKRRAMAMSIGLGRKDRGGGRKPKVR